MKTAHKIYDRHQLDNYKQLKRSEITKGLLNGYNSRGFQKLLTKVFEIVTNEIVSLNIDFHPGLILLNAGILSRMHFRHIVNVGLKRKASECMPLTTGKMNFYASLTSE